MARKRNGNSKPRTTHPTLPRGSKRSTGPKLTKGSPSGASRQKGTIVLEQAYYHSTDTVEIDLSPLTWSTTRLGAYAQLFDRVIYRELKVRFVPSVTYTTAGVMSYFIEPDPSDQHCDNDLQFIMDNKYSVSGHISQSTSTPPIRSSELKYVTVDPMSFRFSCPGTVFYMVSSYSGSAYDSVGHFELDYTIDFYEPSHNHHSWTGSGDQVFTASAAIAQPSSDIADSDLNVETAAIVPGRWYAARTDPSQANDMKLVNGTAQMNPGSRVFWKAATQYFDDTADTLTHLGGASTTYVGIVRDVMGAALRYYASGANTLNLIGRRYRHYD